MSILTKEEVTFTGKTLLMSRDEEESQDPLVYNVIKQDEYGIANISLQDGDVVIVIGAHVGGFTLLLTTLGKKLEIYSYEPVTINYDLLIENIKNNPTDCNIHAFNLALGDKNEDNYVQWCRYKPNTARFITLNDVFRDNKIERCKLVKFDCEGCEYDTLRGTTKATLRKIQYVVGEWHWLSKQQLYEIVSSTFVDKTEEFGLRTVWHQEPPVGMFFFENSERSEQGGQ